MLENILSFIKRLVPKPIFDFLSPIYHYTLSFLAAVRFGFPSRKLYVVFVTGTKGKTSTSEIAYAMLSAAGHKVALTSTLHFNIGDTVTRNTLHMGTPGRFFVQRHLKQALDAGCTHAVIEMTSQAVVQHRHRFIEPDALIFTGIHPEHIEAHGTFDNYLAAKLELAHALERSSKKNRAVIANADDDKAHRFLETKVEQRIGYHLKDLEPHKGDTSGSMFTFEGKTFETSLPGDFNLMNIQAAARLAQLSGASLEEIALALKDLKQIEGRMEFIKVPGKQFAFDTVVDYAHTAGSLEAVYKSFPEKRRVCILGSMGAGRDSWKRPEMGKMADKYCDKIILTNEDPGDEDPRAIIDDIAAGITKHEPEIIINRREAIRKALTFAYDACMPDESGQNKCAVIITGKGTDPFILEAGGKKTPWSDKKVAEEELEKLN